LPIRRAKQQLARLCLNQDRYAEALRWYDQLAALDSDPQLKAFGIAGQCASYYYLGKPTSAVERLVILKELWPSPEVDNDVKLRTIITNSVYPELRKELSAKEAGEWDARIERRSG
jgi:tetratricopeptide (TPR) repeat protein